ncbi:MFS transporter [Kribbella amoyensis]|uniref:MFS transporter n=1 Tax=Kribbella amoyensis TaxID=996641 RepID=UPI0014792734|nr:MFS transporter [Kribbella amoyensis]
MTGNSWLSLTVVCVAQFVVVLDATIVTTALPAIGRDLGFAPAALTWVVTAYTIVLAGLLILGGRIADLAGSRRLFRIGLFVFTTASLGCALAWSPGALIGARLVQGAGAALLSPAALAVLTELMPPQSRRKALGWWTAAAAGGGASGWLLGGVVTELAGWRWVFAVNVPIGVAGLLAAFAVMPGRGAVLARRPLDVPGAAAATTGIAVLTLALAQLAAAPAHWSGWTLLTASLIAFTWFVRVERRAARPLIPGRLIRTPGVVVGNVTAAALTGSTSPATITVTLYVQQTLHLSPARAALLYPAFNLAVIGGSLLSGRAADAVRPLLLAGFGGIVGGIVLLLALPADGVPVALLLSAFVAMGTGLGVASVASTTAGTAAVPEADRGVAAGLLNSTAQLGTALGLAVATPLVASTAPMTGYRLGFAVAGLVALAGAVGACSGQVRARLGLLPARSATGQPEGSE